MDINYSYLPGYMVEPTRLYIEEGHQPGDFLFALFSNDFMGVMGRADETNRTILKEWSMFLYNEAPSRCYGSTELVKTWIRQGGMLPQLLKGKEQVSD